MTGHYRSPERLLADLGITEPADIDLDAIAFDCGALVIHDALRGCEARLLGVGDKAFITVNATANMRRQRFSIGHELGHWMNDRGAASFRCTKRDFIRSWDQVSPEQRANRYAADLLLPKSMFLPRARQQPMTLATASDLADLFVTSLTSTAIRLVECGSFPAMVVLVGPNGIRWPKRGPMSLLRSGSVIVRRQTASPSILCAAERPRAQPMSAPARGSRAQTGLSSARIRGVSRRRMC